MRPVALVACVLAMLAALAGLAFALDSFNSHQGLPYHISAGTLWGHVVPGEPDVVSGHALGARSTTRLLLDAQEAPYDRNHWRVIDSTSRLGPGGSYRFVVRPIRRTRYQVLASVDHVNRSRVVAIIVDPLPRKRR